MGIVESTQPSEHCNKTESLFVWTEEVCFLHSEEESAASISPKTNYFLDNLWSGEL